MPFFFWLDCALSAVLTLDGADRLRQPRLWAIHRTEALLSSSIFPGRFNDLLWVMYDDHSSDSSLADFTFKRMIRPFLTLKQGEFVKVFSDWIKQEQVDSDQNDHRQRIRLLLVMSKSSRNQQPRMAAGPGGQQDENANSNGMSEFVVTYGLLTDSFILSVCVFCRNNLVEHRQFKPTSGRQAQYVLWIVNG